MFRLQPKPKERRKVPIPTELAEAMREVHWRIEEAKRDPDISIDYDDAIQVGSLCGGRCGKKPRPYEFRYVPYGKREIGRWQLDLAQCEIEDIADGVMTEITMYCCTTPNCGEMFNLADGHCDCDYVKDPDFGTFEFPEAMDKLRQRGVVGIGEDPTRDDVVAKLGAPQETGGDATHSFGYIWPWIVYLRDDCQLRFEFDKQQHLRNITVNKKDWAPGK